MAKRLKSNVQPGRIDLDQYAYAQNPLPEPSHVDSRILISVENDPIISMSEPSAPTSRGVWLEPGSIHLQYDTLNPSTSATEVHNFTVDVGNSAVGGSTDIKQAFRTWLEVSSGGTSQDLQGVLGTGNTAQNSIHLTKTTVIAP